MNYFSLDALIIYAFLLLTLVVGLWAGRQVKTMREYAIGNRTHGTGVITMTILATYITGSKVLGYVGYVFDDGLLPIVSIVFCSAILDLLFIARYIAPRMYYFDGCLTLAELMGKLYGSKTRTCISILGVFYCLVMVTLQIIWIGYVGDLINLPKQWAVFSGGTFLILYAARGGMRAIAVTDVLQFIAITLILPIAADILFQKIGNIHTIITHVPAKNFDLIHHPNFKDYIVYCIWGLFPAFPLSFPFMQRILMAKDKRQIANSQYIGMVYLTGFYIILTCIGLAAIALKEMGDANMPQRGSEVFIYLIKKYAPLGFKGLIGVGLLAAVMSTADSFLHAAGLLVAHDLIQPICFKKNITLNPLNVSRYATLTLGCIALFVALTHNILPRIQYGGLDLGRGINMGLDFVAIVFTIPMIAGIMGLKTDEKSFFISFIATLISFFIGRWFVPNLFFIPLNILINAISFFGVHLIINKGFVTTKRPKLSQ